MVINAIPAEEIYEDSCGRKGLGETPQCVSTRRLTSRPRKAKYISEADINYFVRLLFLKKYSCPNLIFFILLLVLLITFFLINQLLMEYVIIKFTYVDVGNWS